VRNVFIVGPDKKIKLILVYPMSASRNFDEVLRVLDSLQLTAKRHMAPAANWKRGEDVIIAGSVSDDEAEKLYPWLGQEVRILGGIDVVTPRKVPSELAKVLGRAKII